MNRSNGAITRAARWALVLGACAAIVAPAGCNPPGTGTVKLSKNKGDIKREKFEKFQPTRRSKVLEAKDKDNKGSGRDRARARNAAESESQ